ncbi:DUF2637 domain-containing protein [Streptomyces sp. NPDC059101]|uniref:DUF2637 domain-containing protein n=1 Tax=Streptomyces sp. NPDC059101 TaxID=3346728 RepID=UPI0036977595
MAMLREHHQSEADPAPQQHRVVLTRVHRLLAGVVIFGALVIAAIGFAGSYTAVHDLAVRKGFGWFAVVFPIGIDCGILSLLALDLLLTWIRIPFPLLRQTAWLLTAATIAFNGAAAWPDPLGVGMHGVIPVLFVVAVEAGRHAVGRLADLVADDHMDKVRYVRWLLAPCATAVMWRRMKLWEVRSYRTALALEQERLIYRAQLRAKYGRRWRRIAAAEALMPLRLARYGVPLATTAPDGLRAAGLDPALSPVAGSATGRQAVADGHPTVPLAVSSSVADPAQLSPEEHDGAAVSATEQESSDEQQPLPQRSAGVSHEPVPMAQANASGSAAALGGGPLLGAGHAQPTRARATATVHAQRGHAQHGQAAHAAVEVPEEPPADKRAEQLQQIVDWLTVEGKVSGAEVGRRLGVPTRTGLRLLNKAQDLHKAQQRKNARAHLHSVGPRS